MDSIVTYMSLNEVDYETAIKNAKNSMTNVSDKEAMKVITALVICETFEDLCFLHEATAFSEEGVVVCRRFFERKIDRIT